MQIARHLAPLLLASLAACSSGPTRDDALQAIRQARPELDTAAVTVRVWQDGPPWFSCAEVLAKALSRTDSTAVRDQVGNWKSLVTRGWITLRDTAGGPVIDPGWCVLTPTAAGLPHVARWAVAPGALQPTGRPRRGWLVPAGRRRIVVPSAPVVASRDLATAPFLVTVATNEDGAAAAAGRDTARFIADLRRENGRWRVAATRAAPAGVVSR